MSKLKARRLEIVKTVMRNRGIEHGDKCIISLWDLAYHINNRWDAKHFVNTKRFKSDSDRDFVLRQYNLGEMFRAIIGCMDSPLELRASYHNRSEYVLWSRYEGAPQ